MQDVCVDPEGGKPWIVSTVAVWTSQFVPAGKVRLMEAIDLHPVAQRTLVDEAAAQLRAAIRSGTIPYGTRLVEAELAQRLGMSRIPVREAIERLAREGLVKKLPHRGAIVYAPTDEEIKEVTTLRIILERFVVELAIARWNDAAEMQLRAIVAGMREAARREDCQALVDLDTEFHQTLWQLAGHNLVFEIISGLRARIARLLYETISIALGSDRRDDFLLTHVQGHEALIDALTKGNVTVAQEAIAEHIRGAETRILEYLEAKSPAPSAETP